MSVVVSFCVVNTAQRELLLRGLDAIGREVAALGEPCEVLVLDNASGDGSADAARAHPVVDEVIELPRRTGKAANDSTLLERARGEFALLLNEDSELIEGATRALLDALRGDAGAATAGGALLRPDGVAQASAWRFPSLGSALAQALLLHRSLVVQSSGDAVRRVDWCQSAALLVRRSRRRVRRLSGPGVLRLRRRSRLPEALARRGLLMRCGCPRRERSTTSSSRPARYRGGASSSCAATATATCASITARPSPCWRVRSTRSLMRCGHWRPLVLPGHSAARYWAHVVATLAPGRGEGLREAAERPNPR